MWYICKSDVKTRGWPRERLCSLARCNGRVEFSARRGKMVGWGARWEEQGVVFLIQKFLLTVY